MTRYPRDLVGYGGAPPNPKWPDGARVVVQFVLNYEEGGENSILHGDAGSEAFLSDMVGAQSSSASAAWPWRASTNTAPAPGSGGCTGCSRRAACPLTVFGVAAALQRNPHAVEAMMKAGWEIASHGYRWIDYQHVPEAVEREHIARAVEIQTALTGERPLGWYQGRTSPNTARLVVEEGGFVYDADSYADDLPYYDTRWGRPQLIVPYTLEANDMKFVAPERLRRR